MFRFFLVVFISLFCSNLQAEANTDNSSVAISALAISVQGTSLKTDQEVERRLRNLIGSFISKGFADKFIIHAYEKNGGFFACLQVGPTVNEDTFQGLIDTFQAMPYNQSTTTYAVNAIESCHERVTVYKYDQSVQCNNESGIPLATMQKELEDNGISVYSAEKIYDGLAWPGACGAGTGLINSYTIQQSDLNKALELGFRFWAGPPKDASDQG